MTGVKAAIANVANVDRSKVVWKMPVRSSAVILVLITAFALADRPLQAVPVTVGALFSAIADVGEPLGHRWRTMLWTTTWLMVAGLIGESVSDTPLLVLVISIVIAAACGFAGVLGQRAALAGTLTLVTLTIFAGIPEIGNGFIPNALLIGLGGFIQTLVTCVPALLFKHESLHKTQELGAVLPRLRAGFSWSNPFVRHSVRLTIALMISTGISVTWATAHSYWIPMTVAWIAKPDQGGTIDKVVGRIAGTILGLLAVAIAVDVLGLGDVGKLLSVVVGSMIVLMFVWANYALAVMGVTILMAALFAPAFNASIASTLWLRIFDTLLGGAITIAVSFLWKVRSTQIK